MCPSAELKSVEYWTEADRWKYAFLSASKVDATSGLHHHCFRESGIPFDHLVVVVDDFMVDYFIDCRLRQY